MFHRKAIGKRYASGTQNGPEAVNVGGMLKHFEDDIGLSSSKCFDPGWIIVFRRPYRLPQVGGHARRLLPEQ
jgi:hypothetical protein